MHALAQLNQIALNCRALLWYHFPLERIVNSLHDTEFREVNYWMAVSKSICDVTKTKKSLSLSCCLTDSFEEKKSAFDRGPRKLVTSEKQGGNSERKKKITLQKSRKRIHLCQFWAYFLFSRIPTFLSRSKPQLLAEFVHQQREASSLDKKAPAPKFCSCHTICVGRDKALPDRLMKCAFPAPKIHQVIHA